MLNRSVTVRPIEPDLELIPDEGVFQFHGRAVLLWNTGRLDLGPRSSSAPLTPSVKAMAEPQEVTISSQCDPPNLRLSRTCSTTGGLHTWRVRNPESVPVDFNAEVLGTRPAELHVGTVPANGEAHLPDPGPGTGTSWSCSWAASRSTWGSA